MKASTAKGATAPPAPVFPKALHRVRARGKATAADPKPEKRDNIFSKSRDTREDRGTRQIRTGHNSETLFRACGDFTP